MFHTTFLTGLGAIVGTASSIILTSLVKNLAPQIQLTMAASLGAVCSSILVCRENSIRRKLGKEPETKKKRPLSKLRNALFWLMLVGGLAAVVAAGLKMSGRL